MGSPAFANIDLTGLTEEMDIRLGGEDFPAIVTYNGYADLEITKVHFCVIGNVWAVLDDEYTDSVREQLETVLLARNEQVLLDRRIDAFESKKELAAMESDYDN